MAIFNPKLSKNALLLLNKHTKNYLQLLAIPEKLAVKVKRLRILAIEIFETLKGFNTDFMKDIFYHRP